MLINILKSLKADSRFMSSVAHWEVIPARPGQYLDFPPEVDREIKNALQTRGITRLYTHQHACYRLARQAKHLVVVTPTASGKTLCYNLPVFQALKEDPNLKAMYIFPTKALPRTNKPKRMNSFNRAG
jgi:DEAD/DEAH box helicase domain-containing protein